MVKVFLMRVRFVLGTRGPKKTLELLDQDKPGHPKLQSAKIWAEINKKIWQKLFDSSKRAFSYD